MGAPELDKIKAGKAGWERKCLKPVLRRSAELRKEFRTGSGSPVERLYTPLEVKDTDYLEEIGFPGEYPFTRGVYPTMYRGHRWTMRMTAGYGLPKDTNRRLKYLLDHGETGIGLANDTPTLMGMDSDDPRAAGEVGKTGAIIDSLQDMEEIYDGISIDQVSSSLINVNVAYCVLAIYLALAEKRGVAPLKLVGSMSNDPIRNSICMSGIVLPLRPSVRFTVDAVKYCVENIPKWNPISLAGYHIREWGITASQEMAFTLALGVAYMEESSKLGLDLDKVALSLAFFFNAYTDIFEEAAKYRAGRRVWAKILKERFGVKDPRAMTLRFHVQTAGHSLTAQQPMNNIVRVALQALAAVLGGAQSIHTNSWDEAFAIPSEESVRIALRTQQIIAEESGAAVTIDPLGGSYYVEEQTNRIEAEVLDYLAKIDSLGGTIAAVEQGFFQKEIIATSYEDQKRIESGEKVIVGVNKYQSNEKIPYEFLQVDPQVEVTQVERLKKLRKERNNRLVKAKLGVIRETAANPNGYVMPALIDAAKAYATLGEMVGALKDVVGEYKEDIIL